MDTKTSKAELLDVLRSLVKDMLRLRSEGVSQGEFARAHGYVDGYIRVLLDADLASERELLELVLAERRGSSTVAAALDEVGMQEVA